MPSAFVSMLTDFGTRDPWVAICKGVILSIAPDARLLDISHDIPAFSVRAGAYVLAAAVPELPPGAHLAVVDPGVGTERRPVVVVARRGDAFVGPDNGLLPPAADALGGIVAVHELTNAAYRRAAGSHTFHGRDIFAPAVAHLARGVSPAALGPALDPGTLVRLPAPRAATEAGSITAEARYADGFGNVKLAVTRADLEAALGALRAGDPLLLEWPGGRVETHWGATFGDAAPGQALVYEDSLGSACIAVNQGSAARRLGLAEGMAVTIRKRGGGGA